MTRILALLLIAFSLSGCVFDTSSKGVGPIAVNVTCVVAVVQTPPEVKAWFKKSIIGPDGNVIVPQSVVTWIKQVAVQQETLRRLGCVKAGK